MLESGYQKATQVELQTAGCKRKIECPIQVKYRNIIAGDFRADRFVNDAVIGELKTAKNHNAEDEP